MNTNHKRLITILFCTLLAVLPIHSQQLQASLSHYSTDDGLCSNAVSSLKQDDYGYIWIGTWNGLSRYDGYHFYNYDTGTNSRVPLLHNRMIEIKIDLSQNVWMRMYDGRIFVLDRTADRIINPLAGITGYENFTTNYPLTMTSTGEMMAIIDGVGIYRMRLDKNGLQTHLIATAQYQVTSICEGYQSDLWVGTDQGIHRLDMSDESVDRKGVFTDEHITCLFSNGYNIYAGTKSGKIVTFAYGQEPHEIANVDNALSAIFVDSHGLIWFSASAQGASRLNEQTHDIKHFEQVVPVPEHDIHGATFNEVNGTVWITMNHGGFGYYNREADTVEYFHNDPSNPWNLSNTVAASLPLPEGIIWESTNRRGLEKLEILKNTIGRTKLMPDAEGSNPNEVRAMYYDRERKLLLIGNKTGQLFIYDILGERRQVNAPQPLGRIYGINKDSKGNYWLCSKGTGLIKMTPTGGGYAFQYFKHDESDKMSLSSNDVYYAVEDRHGNIWIATYGGGVNVLTRDKHGRQVFLNYQNVINRYPNKSHRKVRSLTVDKQGNVWAGTTDGLLVMNCKGTKVDVTKVEATNDYEHNLQSNDIVCLACDADGTVWVGTNGGGLSHTMGKDNDGHWRFQSYGSRDGLPSEEIKSITFDLSGNVWFATDHILCSFDTRKHIFSTFGILDGVDDTICSEGAAITMPNGNVLFGTLAGYYTVDRKKLENTNGSMLKLRITDFFLNDVLQSPRYTDTYDYYVPDSRRVELPTHSSVFAFRFASLNYQLQHRVHYQYMLDGYDRDWQNADKSRTVSYSGLPSGTYTFKVKAFLLESPDNYDMRTIEVVVPPYFLLSPGAIWLYMILAAIIALTLIYLQEERLARQHGVKPQQLPSWRNLFHRQKNKTNEQADATPSDAEQTDEYVLISE